MFITTYKNMKKFVNEIFKRTRSGKPGAEEASHIEGCMKANIQDKYNLTQKTSPVDYSDMLMPLTKLCRVKNKCCPFRNLHSRKILRQHMQYQYHMVCVIRASKPSIQRRSITIWVFTYSMDSINNHKYKLNSSHSEWTRYMPIISSTINLGQIQTAVTRHLRHSLLEKPPD